MSAEAALSQHGQWAEQVEASSGVDIRPVPAGRLSMTPGAPMLYPSARMLLDAIMALEPGETITVRELRDRLARQYDTLYTCPVTTTRNLRLVAEAANEARENGEPLDQVTPVWRALEKSSGALRNLSFDPGWIVAERQRERTGT